MKQCPLCLAEYSDDRTVCAHDGALLLQTHEWAPQTIIAGKYRILEKLGEGGMGCVYKAQHLLMEELRALKVMKPEFASDATFLRRFRQEAQVARKLRHKNIVQVDDLDQADDGSLFIAMEFVEGLTLQAILARTGGPLSLLRAITIARGVADALALAHSMGIVHRDIKPGNILVTRDEHKRDLAKVLDFGIVAMKESSTILSSQPLLTPHYASPEQWQGLKSSEIDGRVDLYAFGITLYEMLAGRLPFEAHSREGWMRAHLEEQPPPPSQFCPGLPRSLDTLVLKLLAKDREMRPADAGEVIRELQLIEAEIGWQASPGIQERRGETPATPERRRGYEQPHGKQQRISRPEPQQDQTPPVPQPASPGAAAEFFKIAEQRRQRSDFYEAAKLYEKAAVLGHAGAQHQLGLLYREGKGVEKDEVEAFRWIAAAADQGLPEALYETAVCYWEGIGTDADRDQAFHLMQEAAQRRHPRAPRKLTKWDAEIEAEKKAKRARPPAPRVTSPPLEQPWWKGTKAIVAATTIVLLAVMFSFEGVRNAFFGSSRTDESKSGPPIVTPPPKQVTQKQPWVGPGRESDLFTVLIRDNFETNRIWKALDSAPCRTNYRDSGFELRNEPPQEGSCQFLFWRQSSPAVGELGDAVRISITARPKEMSDSTQSHYGLIFGKATTGDDSDPNQFIFWLDQNGEYELFRYSEERKWAKIFGGTLANAGLPLKSGPGASITLRVDVRGREIWVGVNGKWLRQYTNKSEVRGYSGIYVHKMGDAVLFDDLEISKLIL